MRRWRTFFILISAITSLMLKAQSAHEVYQYALYLHHNQEYTEAIKNLKRVTYLDNGQYYLPACNVIADAYLELQDYPNTLFYLDRLIDNTPDTVQQDSFLLVKAKIYILSEEFLLAKKTLLSMSDKSLDREMKLFYLSVIDFYTHDYVSAQHHFSMLNPGKEQEIIFLLNKANRINKKNAKTAKNLSKIFPGLGQFYAGDIKGGVNSILLLSALTGLYVDIFLIYSPLDAFISVFPWIFRYYEGGFKNAQRVLIEKKEKRLDKIFEELIALF